VCPASWDLGETAKLVLFSTTEGEDKPAKYPKMFQQSSHAVFTKVDLLPHLTFDMEQAQSQAREVNPNLEFLFTSARTGEGLDSWYAFLEGSVTGAKGA
jgi:hydrogenase nickel incorporation protein HypB